MNPTKKALADLKDSTDYMAWRVERLMSGEPLGSLRAYMSVLETQAGRIAQAVANLKDTLESEVTHVR